MNRSVNRRRVAVAVLWLAGGSDLAIAGATEPTVKAALARMGEALHRLNYTGTLVHVTGQRLETLRVTHMVRGDHESTRWVALNGVAQAAQELHAVTHLTPEDAVNDPQALLTTWWPQLDLQRLEASYSLQLLGDYRVAERAAWGVAIIPRDQWRYGYRFYLDQASGLPLKTELMSETAQPLEQFLFTALHLEGIDPTPPVTLPVAAPQLQPARTPLPIASGPWMFSELPVTFEVLTQQRWIDKQGIATRQFVLSDGLAAVSVYIEPDAGAGLHGTAQVGAVNAWGNTLAGHQITAVGEVPAATVHQIALALRQRPDATNE